MSIQVVTDAIKAGLNVIDETIRFEEDRGELDDTNSIMWLPIGGQHSAPAGLGGAFRDGPLFTRNINISFKCWGVDFDATERLVDVLLNVIHEKLSQRSYQPGGEEWAIGSAMNKGRICIVTISLRVPVQRTPGVTVKVTSLTPTFHLDQPEATG